MSETPQLHEILNGFTGNMEQVAGMIEAQRLLIEDLYAFIMPDATAFRQHAEILKSAIPSGAADETHPQMMELRNAARQAHLSSILESVARRIEFRGG